MKIIAPFLLLLAITGSLFTSCTKFEEGPGLSLRSPEAKLDGNWVVRIATQADGDDVTDLYANFTYTFTKDGAFSYRFEQGNFSFDAVGTYSFNKDNSMLSTSASYDFQGLIITDDQMVSVLRLTTDELIILNEDNERVEFQRPV